MSEAVGQDSEVPKRTNDEYILGERKSPACFSKRIGDQLTIILRRFKLRIITKAMSRWSSKHRDMQACNVETLHHAATRATQMRKY